MRNQQCVECGIWTGGVAKCHECAQPKKQGYREIKLFIAVPETTSDEQMLEIVDSIESDTVQGLIDQGLVIELQYQIDEGR
jgi:hypothetical protein